MTFLDKELSADDGQPIELYTFTIGNDIFRYTNTSETQVNAQGTFNAVPMDRTSIEQKQDSGRLPIELTTINTLDAIDRWVETPSTATMTLTIQALHLTDTPTPEIFVIWQGRVLNVEFIKNTAKIRCEPIFTSLKRPGLRRKYQLQCPHVLYGPVCKVDIALHFVDADIASVNGLTIVYENDTNDAGGNPMPSGELTGGYIEWSVSGVTERRAVKSHSAKTITIGLPASSLAPGVSIRMYRGCPRDTVNCAIRFANLDNYGGFPYSPIGRNPFATHSPVF